MTNAHPMTALQCINNTRHLTSCARGSEKCSPSRILSVPSFGAQWMEDTPNNGLTFFEAQNGGSVDK